MLKDEDLDQKLPTVFVADGESLLMLLLGALELRINHEHQLFVYLKLMGVNLATRRPVPIARLSLWYVYGWIPMAPFDAGPPLSRRAWLARMVARAARRKNIAAIITEYRRDSHAYVIIGRLLEGYEYNGRHQAPRVEVVSMYTDQVPANDMSRAMAAKHGVRICPTIHEALAPDSGLAAEGVVLVGEHGQYPLNGKGQKLYPRYELYKQIVDVFRETGHSVPIFCDKHLSYDWQKARWMYEQSRALRFPLMAGSS